MTHKPSVLNLAEHQKLGSNLQLWLSKFKRSDLPDLFVGPIKELRLYLDCCIYLALLHSREHGLPHPFHRLHDSLIEAYSGALDQTQWHHRSVYSKRVRELARELGYTLWENHQREELMSRLVDRLEIQLSIDLNQHIEERVTWLDRIQNMVFGTFDIKPDLKKHRA